MKEAIPDLMESFQIADPKYVDSSQFPTKDMEVSLVPLYNEFTDLGQLLLTYLAQGLPQDDGDINEEPTQKRSTTTSSTSSSNVVNDLFSREHVGKSRTVLRITRYPALNEISSFHKSNEEDVSRISPHRDLGTLTLLIQDDQGGINSDKLVFTYMFIFINSYIHVLVSIAF